MNARPARSARRSRHRMAAAGIAIAAAVALAGCSSSGSSSPSGSAEGTDPDAFTVLVPNENATLATELTALSEDQCKAENDDLPLEIENVAQTDVVQKVTLLGSQGALPAHFVAGTDMVRPDGDLGAAGLVLDYEDLLTGEGVWDDILPAAASTVKAVYGGMVSLPYQYNLEGVWYNKAIFSELGIEEPQTWEELMDASAAVEAAGYQAFSEGGSDGWPLTRLIGMYIFRNAGPDAMEKVMDGEAKLTDDAYLAAAQALADMADEGYFGEGVTSTDSATAVASFLSGSSAMIYNGTWMLSNINDATQNEIGAENVGFMPFPAVEGGTGTIEQWSANAGTAFAANPETAGPKVKAWFACIAENYGQQALQDAGVLSGFTVNGEVTDLPEATAAVQETMSSISETVLWFEALMDAKSNSLASTNVALLVTGQLTPEEYMSQLQDSIDQNR